MNVLGSGRKLKNPEETDTERTRTTKTDQESNLSSGSPRTRTLELCVLLAVTLNEMVACYFMPEFVTNLFFLTARSNESFITGPTSSKWH